MLPFKLFTTDHTETYIFYSLWENTHLEYEYKRADFTLKNNKSIESQLIYFGHWMYVNEVKVPQFIE